ncbi:MAG TPA: tetratricopeptide repeat protein [Nannocystaceae bacterium]|nr:tetratricopeptide repeat protein [Nannocystaceae bacterium]
MSRPEAASDQTEDERAAAARAPLVVPQPGEPIGRFFVVDVLGQGAMGVVVRAFDPRLERTLAIKLVHPRRSDAAVRARARLIAEARALARLSHPNVVAVYEVDVHEGRDYVAMELVEGIDLQKWLRMRPRGWREVVEAFAAAADGLAAVHAAGIVHRDVKPANILVGRDGRVRVGDFGIATRSTDATHSLGPPSGTPDLTSGDARDSLSDDGDPDAVLTSLTEEGQVVGTPAYMAPEQHVGAELGPAADQYAFCVSLYEALYGQRPFRVPLLQLAMAKRKPPREPKKRGVPRWLYGVVARGLSPDPSQRFRSMAELATALRRDVGRKRRRIAFAAATIAGVAAGALVMSQQRACTDAEAKLAGVWDSTVRASVEQAFAASARPYAAQAWAQASAQLDGYASRWIAMHTDACTATSIRHEQSEAMLDRRMACLEQRKTGLAATVELLAAGGDDAIDHAYEMTGRLRPIAACGDLDALADAVAPPEDPQVRSDVESVRGELARASAAKNAGRYDEALALSGPPLQQARELGYEPLIAEAQLVRADALATRSRLDEARTEASEAIWSAIAVGDDETATSAAISLLWLTSEDLRDFPAAGQWAALGHALLRRSGEQSLVAARFDNAEGSYLLNIGRYDEATAVFERGLARIAGDDDGVQIAHNMRINLANVWNNTGHNAKARAAYELEIAELGALIGSDHPSVIGVRRTLADLLSRIGEHERAVAMAREVADALERVYGRDSPLFGHALLTVGLAVDRTGDYKSALADYQEAIAVLERGHDPVGLAIALNNAGEVQLRLGVFDAASHAFDRAIAIQQATYGGDHPDLVFPMVGKARLFSMQHRWDEATAATLEAERITIATMGPDSHELITVKDTMMEILAGQERFAEALVPAQASLEIALRTEDVRPRTRPLARAHVAALLNRLQRPAEALPLLETAALEVGGGVDAELGVEIELERAMALKLLGRSDESVASAERARRLAEDGGFEKLAAQARGLLSL